MKIFIDTKLISKIEVHDKYTDSSYEYRLRKTFFGIRTQRQGWYVSDYDGYTYEGMKPNCCSKRLWIGDKVYHKPEVRIYYKNKTSDTYEFQSYKNAIQWADNILKETNLFELTHS